MKSSVLVVARKRIEAARRIEGGRRTNLSRGLHGHGFVVSVQAHIPNGWASFDGSECHDIDERLGHCVRPLDYSLLNEQIATPTDENIATWIGQRIEVPGVRRIAVQSTPSQGVCIEPEGMRTQLWRRYTFHAAHRLPYVPVGHKCGRLHGHGFAVVIHVARDGASQCPDYDELDTHWAPLHSVLNYRCLNDIVGLQNPTSEILSSWLWEQLKPSCPSLSAVTVFETGSCGATYNGSEYRIWKDFSLDSAVRMASAPTEDPRYQIHGHTYTLRLKLTAPLDTVMGWTVDFGDVKSVFEPIFKSVDHRPLHEQQELANGDPASIARWIYQRALTELPQLCAVELYETSGCGVIVGDHERDPGLPA